MDEIQKMLIKFKFDSETFCHFKYHSDNTIIYFLGLLHIQTLSFPHGGLHRSCWLRLLHAHSRRICQIFSPLSTYRHRLSPLHFRRQKSLDQKARHSNNCQCHHCLLQSSTSGVNVIKRVSFVA